MSGPCYPFLHSCPGSYLVFCNILSAVMLESVVSTDDIQRKDSKLGDTDYGISFQQEDTGILPGKFCVLPEQGHLDLCLLINCGQAPVREGRKESRRRFPRLVWLTLNVILQL